MHRTESGPDDQGRAMRLRIPDGRDIEVRPRASEHLLFGVCDDLAVDGEVLARCAAVDWDRPGHIPPLDRPGALPAGAGTAVLNELARRARAPLRYRGPYPTAALFDALLECFRVKEPVAAYQGFTAGVEALALSGATREAPVDFSPAPFQRVWHPRVCIQLRDGVEKIFVNGRAHARDAAGPRRVRRDGAHWTAVVEIGGTIWATLARVDASGALMDGPHPLPAVRSPLLGRALPGAVQRALAAALPPRAPGLAQKILYDLLGKLPMRWGDTGDELAVAREDGIEIHALLMERMADAPPSELLEALARAVEPVAQRLAQRLLTEQITP